MTIGGHPASTQRASLKGKTARDRTLQAPAARVRRWQRLVGLILAGTDLAVMLLAVSAAHLLRFGSDPQTVSIPAPTGGDLRLAYLVVSAALVLGWALSLQAFATRHRSVVGAGLDEYRRVTHATFAFFALLAIVVFSLQIPVSRGYLFMSLAIGWVLLLVSRSLWRRWLHGHRRRGRFLTHAVLVGEQAGTTSIAERIERDRSLGIRIVGVVPDTDASGRDVGDLLRRVDELAADTVILAAEEVLRPDQLRELGGELDRRRATLIVTPALTDIAGPAIRAERAAEAALLKVDSPRLSTLDRLLKRLFDVFGALVMLLLAAPIMLAVAIMIRGGTHGPVLEREERIGRDGAPFTLWRFRARAPLRELPQLFTVLTGSMSLVGPRPKTVGDVSLDERRRRSVLAIKPGMTGLSHLSGHGDLPWEDRVRLDLHYVQNWSLTADVVIMWRTIRAALRSFAS